MTRQSSDPSFLSTIRLPVMVGLAAMGLLIVGLGVWGTQAEINGAVVASGRVIVERNRQAIQHPDGGVVDEVPVHEGERVERGALLVRLDPTLARTELRVAENQLYELMARRGRLTAERDNAKDIVFDPALLDAARKNPQVAELVEGQRALFEAKLTSFAQAVEQMEAQEQQLRNQIKGIDAVELSLTRQLALVRDELSAQEQLLAKGLSPMTRVLALRREVERLSGSSGEATARRAQALERIAEIRIELSRMQAQRQEEAITTLRDLQVSELEIAERRDAIRIRLDRMDIRAPVGGVVYDIRLQGERSVLRPADPVMFIVPQDRPLVIECHVNPMNVSLVHVGQDVVVRFPAFDMRETPDLIGKVTQVSPDALVEPGDGQTYYRVEVELPDTERDKLADEQTILPGMPVDAYLRTGEYSPFAYLVRPLARYMNGAMRDGG